MKNLKNNKAITLVALIITIIVLLILAIVAISAVQGDGIISKAKTARENYQTAQGEENTILDNYLTTLNKEYNNDDGNDANEEYIIAIVRRDDHEIRFCLYYANSEMSKTDLEKIINQEVAYCTYGGNLSEGVNQEYYELYFKNLDYRYVYCDGEVSVQAKESTENVSYGKIKTIILGNTVTDMMGCFEDCKMNNIPTIPNTITELESCFHRTTFNLNEITTLTIPKSVESIGNLFVSAQNIDKIRIEYEGTINEYKEITNYNRLGIIGLVIHCSDGDYTTTESYLQDDK